MLRQCCKSTSILEEANLRSVFDLAQNPQAWLNNQQVVVGTKCNRLLLLNADTCSAPHLPPLQVIQLPRPPDRQPREPAQAHIVQNALWSVGMLLRSGHNGEHWNGDCLPPSLQISNSLIFLLFHERIALWIP